MKKILFYMFLSAGFASASEYSDDFSTGKVPENSHYIFYQHEAFVQGRGLATAIVPAGKTAVMNILPAFGSRASFSVDVRWRGGNPVSLLLLSDYRYNTIGAWKGVYVFFGENFVRFYNEGYEQRKDFSDRKNRWVKLQVNRDGDKISFLMDGELMLEREIAPRDEAHNVPEEAGYGGFGIKMDYREKNQLLEFDNLKVSGEDSPVTFLKEERRFTLGGKKLKFTVISPEDSAAWAKEVADSSVNFLNFAYGVYGIPPIHPNLGLVAARGRYYDSGAGYNDQGVIFQGAGKWGGANCHELGHNWQHLFGTTWLTEGSADFICALWYEKTNRVVMTTKSVSWGTDERLAGFYSSLNWGSDFTLETEFQTTGLANEQNDNARSVCRNYGQRVFHIMMYRILGADGFRRFHSMALGQTLRGNGRIKGAEARRIMEDIVGKDLEPVFAGWVIPGEGEFPVTIAFADGDQDGLSDLDEKLFGTDPDKADTDGDGTGDLAEIQAGFNPLNASEPGGGIFVDGNGKDWSGIAISNSTAGAEKTNLKNVRLASDDETLFIRVDFFQGDVIKEGWISLDFDVDQTAGTDYRLNFFFPGKQTGLLLARGLEWGKWQNINPENAMVAVGTDQDGPFLEAKIAHRTLENFREAKLAAIMVNRNDWFWSPVTVQSIRKGAAAKDKVWQPRPW